MCCRAAGTDTAAGAWQGSDANTDGAHQSSRVVTRPTAAAAAAAWHTHDDQQRAIWHLTSSTSAATINLQRL